jgi:hypothetical protein
MKKIIYSTLVALSLCLTFFSCKKDNLKLQKEPQSVTQSNSGDNAGDLFKFKKDIKMMAGENCEGYVILTVASNNQSYLDSYCKQYENSKINLIPDGLLQDAKAAVDHFNDADSANYISIHMNLDNLVYKTDKKDHYAFGISNAAGNEKVYSNTYSNITAISFSQPILAISIYNEYRKPFLSGSGRNIATAQWTVHFMGGTEYPYASAYFDYHSNLDVHTFWDYNSPGNFPLASNSTYIQYPYGTYYLRYRARYNYSGPSLPAGAIETNGILSGSGYNSTYGQSCPATVTVYAI